ncbi:hypothetical protein KXX11_001522 [Aspergillus fumigatus]|nr:hypothetical protein KXX11_001522 [Aspergillus fumigatus]
MYGFHKKVGLSDNSMRASERKRNKSGKGNVRVKTEDADDHEHDDYDDATGALRDERARNRELSLVQSVR